MKFELLAEELDCILNSLQGARDSLMFYRVIHDIKNAEKSNSLRRNLLNNLISKMQKCQRRHLR